jgi:hypothetical protein
MVTRELVCALSCILIRSANALEQSRLRNEISSRGYDTITAVTESGPLPPISDDCQKQIRAFGNTSSVFTECALVHSYPNGVCFHCADAFAAMERAYNDMQTDESPTEESEPCINVFQRSLINYVDAVHKSLEQNIWTASNCIQCIDFGTNGPAVSSNHSVKPAAQLMINISQKFQDCFDSHIVTNDGGSNNSVCQACKADMDALNANYRKYSLDHRDEPYCVDVKTHVNSSWHLWEMGNCSRTSIPVDASSVVSLAVAFFFLIATVFFYVGSYMQASREVRRFRKYHHVESDVQASEPSHLVHTGLTRSRSLKTSVIG